MCWTKNILLCLKGETSLCVGEEVRKEIQEALIALILSGNGVSPKQHWLGSDLDFCEGSGEQSKHINVCPSVSQKL